MKIISIAAAALISVGIAVSPSAVAGGFGGGGFVNVRVPPPPAGVALPAEVLALVNGNGTAEQIEAAINRATTDPRQRANLGDLVARQAELLVRQGGSQDRASALAIAALRVAKANASANPQAAATTGILASVVSENMIDKSGFKSPSPPAAKEINSLVQEVRENPSVKALATSNNPSDRILLSDLDSSIQQANASINFAPLQVAVVQPPPRTSP